MAEDLAIRQSVSWCPLNLCPKIKYFEKQLNTWLVRGCSVGSASEETAKVVTWIRRRGFVSDSVPSVFTGASLGECWSWDVVASLADTVVTRTLRGGCESFPRSESVFVWMRRDCLSRVASLGFVSGDFDSVVLLLTFDSSFLSCCLNKIEIKIIEQNIEALLPTTSGSKKSLDSFQSRSVKFSFHQHSTTF